MTDHPSTFRGPDDEQGGIQWDDRASLHKADDGHGVFDGAKALRSGSFAEMIEHVMLLPETERTGYVIEKAGDRIYKSDEIAVLATNPSFPRRS